MSMAVWPADGAAPASLAARLPHRGKPLSRNMAGADQDT